MGVPGLKELLIDFQCTRKETSKKKMWLVFELKFLLRRLRQVVDAGFTMRVTQALGLSIYELMILGDRNVHGVAHVAATLRSYDVFLRSEEIENDI